MLSSTITDNEGSTRTAQSMNDGEYGLHPDDVLIMKWLPDADPLNLDNMTGRWRARRRTMLSWARRQEQEANNSDNTLLVPPKPWLLPPLRPRIQLESGTEEWRTLRVQMIDAHVEPWINSLQALPCIMPDTALLSPSNRGDNERMHLVESHHRVLRIPELLNTILGYLNPGSQFTARNVCHQWRAALGDMIGYKFRTHKPCGPIEYLQPIASDFPELRPSISEIDNMRNEVTQFLAVPQSLSRDAPMLDSCFNFPARLHQAVALDDSTLDLFHNMLNTDPYHRLAPKLPDVPSWMDLTQVTFNPYFTHLFSGRLTFPFGYCSIDLVLDCDNVTNSPAVRSQEAYDLISPMYVTQPPCKALGVYADYGKPPNLRYSRLGRAVDENGVTIANLLDTLRQCAPKAIERWRIEVISAKQRVAGRHWTFYTYDSEKKAMWDTISLPIIPRLSIVLESAEGKERIWVHCLWETARFRFGPEDWKAAFKRWAENNGHVLCAII